MLLMMMVMIVEDDEVSPAYFQITSYGGKLTYTLGYEIPQGSSLPVLTTKPDIVIEVSSYDLDYLLDLYLHCMEGTCSSHNNV